MIYEDLKMVLEQRPELRAIYIKARQLGRQELTKLMFDQHIEEQEKQNAR